MRPAPEVTEVEITMDNPWDYFELVENRQEQTDANGNMTRLYITYTLSLKNGYELADQNEYTTDVAIGYEYDKIELHYRNPSFVDFEAFT